MANSINIYLDYQASTPLCDEAKEAMLEAENQAFANPHSSDHNYGWKASSYIDDSNEVMCNFLNATSDEIIFTSGATESNNLAILGSAFSALKNKSQKNKIITSAIEHKCVIGAAKFANSHLGFEHESIPVNNEGIIDLRALEKAANNNTLIVSVMAVNNEIGTIQPLKEIGEICRKNGALFHVDASQALYEKIDPELLKIDLLSLSSHKMYGPKGVGLLYINKNISIKPTAIFSGGEQQNGFRSGTMPTPLIYGFAKAAEYLDKNKDSEKSRLLFLRNKMLAELEKAVSNFKLNGSLENRHAGNINILIPNIDGKTLIAKTQPFLAISTGSACTSGIPEPSHVLRSIGLNTNEAESSIRVSIGRYTTEEEIERAVQLIKQAYDSLI